MYFSYLASICGENGAIAKTIAVEPAENSRAIEVIANSIDHSVVHTVSYRKVQDSDLLCTQF